MLIDDIFINNEKLKAESMFVVHYKYVADWIQAVGV